MEWNPIAANRTNEFAHQLSHETAWYKVSTTHKHPLHRYALERESKNDG